MLTLQLLTESYAREMVLLVQLSLSSVQKGLQSLERDGLIASRTAGRTRLYRMNPRTLGRRELEHYLVRLLEPKADLRARSEGLRRRPRRTGKPM